jgi:hypothetical protein
VLHAPSAAGLEVVLVEGGEQRRVVVQVGNQGGQHATGRRGGEPVDHLAQAGDEVGPDVTEVGERVGGHDADHGVRDHGGFARPAQVERGLSHAGVARDRGDGQLGVRHVLQQAQDGREDLLVAAGVAGRPGRLGVVAVIGSRLCRSIFTVGSVI